MSKDKIAEIKLKLYNKVRFTNQLKYRLIKEDHFVEEQAKLLLPKFQEEVWEK